MRYVVFLAGFVLLFAGGASAQVDPRLPSSPASLGPQASASATSPDPELALAPALAPISTASSEAGSATSASAQEAQVARGVFANYRWQFSLGYTFARFYEAPGFIENRNGFYYGVVYYVNSWIGADGEFDWTHGSQSGVGSRFLLGMGGVRLRWAKPRNLEFWVHGLVGGAQYTPQTPFGGQKALGYELGGGVDINTNHRRLAYRIQGDLVGSRFFGTYQYSPKISVGIVLKF